MNKLRAGKASIDWVGRKVYIALLICRDPRVPWYTKVIAGFCIGYIFSPIQIFPNFIPILGWIDDVFIVSFGISAAIKLTPQAVLAECYERTSALDGAEMAISGTARWAILSTCIFWLFFALAGGIVTIHMLHR